MKVNVSVHLFTCRKCKKGYNNRLKHTCVVHWSELSGSNAKPKKRR